MALTKVGKEGITGISNSSDANAITIDSSENVGIGTSTIDSALHIEQNASGVTETSGSTLKIHNTNASGRSKISLHNNAETASGSIYYDTDSGMLALQGDTGAGVVIQTNGNNERLRVDANGVLLVGTVDTSPFNNTSGNGTSISGGEIQLAIADSEALYVNRMGSDGRAVNFRRAGSFVGGINVDSSSTSYNTSSDYRLKENVADVTGAIDRVKALAPKRFNFIVNPDTTVDGFLAHEAQAVVPEAVTGTHNEVDDDGNAVMQGIDQSKLVPLLTGALKEAVAKIEALETEMTALKARVTTLEGS